MIEPMIPDLDEQWGRALYEAMRVDFADLIPPWPQLSEHNRAVYRRQGRLMRTALDAGQVPRPRTAEEQIADEAADAYERDFWAPGGAS